MSLLFEELSKEAANEANTAPVNKYEKNDNRASVLAKLVYSLAMFHSLLIERRKFKGYGWTKSYDFNNSDFKIAFDILRTYCKRYINPQDFPWKAIQDLICINYGSRFTNPKDLELLQCYAEHFFNANLIIDKNYNLSSSPDIFYPLLDDSLFEKYKNTITSDSSNANKRGCSSFVTDSFLQTVLPQYKRISLKVVSFSSVDNPWQLNSTFNLVE